jgi:hypothetical protein
LHGYGALNRVHDTAELRQDAISDLVRNRRVNRRSAEVVVRTVLDPDLPSVRLDGCDAACTVRPAPGDPCTTN